MITLEDFGQLELRIGEILEAESIPNSDRLLKLTVSLGEEQRTIVAGIKQSYTPDELHGLKVVVLANLAPAKIRGIESQGMLLGVGCDDPTAVALLTPSRQVPNGMQVV